MSDTARLQVSIEARNLSGPGLDAFRRSVEQANVTVEKLALNSRQVARISGTTAVPVQGIQAFRAELERATGGAVGITQQIGRLPVGLRDATREMSALTQGIGHGLGLFSSFGAGIGTAVITAAIVGGIARTATAFGEFDRQVRGTNALLDLTGDAAERSFGRMQRDVRAAGVELGVGATSAAKGLYDVISAGIPVGREAFEVLRVSSLAAVGGLTDVQTAADGVTSVLNAYRLTTADAARVSDQMFQTVNIGKITFAQLSQNIGTVVPLAAAMGVNFAEVGANIAVATQQGQRGGQAIEGLRAALGAFLKPSDDAVKVASALGVGFDAATVQSKGFNAALNDVVRATGGSRALLGRLFGDIQAINFAFAVSGQSADTTARAIDQIGTASGTTSRAAQQVELSLGRAFDRAKAQAEEVGLSIGQAASGPLTRLLNVATGVGQAFNAWPKDIPSRAQINLVEELAAQLGVAEEHQRKLREEREKEEGLGRALGQAAQVGANLLFGRGARNTAGQVEQLEVDLHRRAEAQETLNRINQAGGILEARAKADLDAHRISEEQFQRVIQGAPAIYAEYNRQLAEGNAVTLEAVRVQVEAAKATGTQNDATARAAEELLRLSALADTARKALATQAESAPGRAEQDALRQLREQTSNAERTAQRDAERGQRTLEERARSLQDAAEKGRDALQNLRDAAADARGELEALAKVKVQGTAEQENRVFALGTRAAQDQLVLDQARLARLQARQQGLPRPPVDRAALRAAARDLQIAELEGKVVEGQGRTTIAPTQRAVDQALNPPQELPAGDLLARARVARTAVTRVEGQSEYDFQRRQREAEARVRSQEREAQAAQRAAQDQSRADALRLQGIRDTNQALIDEAENKAKSAELDRQRITYEQQYQAILDAREAQAKAGIPLEKINKDNPLPPPPSQGAAPAIAALASRQGFTVTPPGETPTVTTVAGTGTPQPVSITIAPGAITVDVHTTGDVDGAALGEQVIEGVFDRVRTEFRNAPEGESAGVRYGRGG